MSLFVRTIVRKRDGAELSEGEIADFVRGVTEGEIPDEQAASFLMAVCCRGMTTAETAALTFAMMRSGETWDLSRFGFVGDKHSTGGVGDKATLPLAPLLASVGVKAGMMSGRGLGHTGGTLDKLESIPGFKTALPKPDFDRLLDTVGCALIGQTESIAPADRRLYALRDVTGTVESIPLITASILSKKLAEDLDALVLDVKFGCAAVMPTLEKARELARALATLSNECGVNTRALITNMDTPLGRAAGNWLEVKESVACLTPQPASPASRITHHASPSATDLRDLTLACAAHLLVQTGKAPSLDAARQQAADCLASGQPLSKWNEMLAAQGADLAAYERKLALDHTAPVVMGLKAPGSGFVSRCDARIVGEVIRELGGGRLTKDSVLNYDVGVDAILKPGEAVQAGDPLARIHAADRSAAEAACVRLKAAFDISAQPPAAIPLIAETIPAQASGGL